MTLRPIPELRALWIEAVCGLSQIHARNHGSNAQDAALPMHAQNRAKITESRSDPKPRKQGTT